eukprot:6550463-Alexandrium_andersonii.AAC.1
MQANVAWQQRHARVQVCTRTHDKQVTHMLQHQVCTITHAHMATHHHTRVIASQSIPSLATRNHRTRQQRTFHRKAQSDQLPAWYRSDG